MQDKLHEVLEDLSSRFVLNLPDEELASLERVCFQVEQAHWYYEDFIREQDPSFPTMSLKKFSNSLFHVCPLLRHWGDEHEQTFQNFLAYKTRVPVCGAIMLNESWDKCLLVKGWKATSAWSFPKGKINEQEPRSRCAIREVLEETGYDLDEQIDLENVVEVSIKEQSISLFIVPNVPEDFPFKTRTRKEISKISWFKLTDLPTWKRNKAVPGKFYLITPFIGPLRAFIRDNKPKTISRKCSSKHVVNGCSAAHESDEDVHKPNAANRVTHIQESSSQSSSANGEPKTPPQSSNPPVHRANGDSSHGLDNGLQNLSLGVDPHFARLLTALTQSASSTDVSQEQTAVPDATKAAPSSTPGANNPLPYPKRPSVVSADRTNPANQTLPPQPSHSQSYQDIRASDKPSLPHTSNPTSTSPRSPLASSKTAPSDISPYLSKATVNPGIQKQIKYLAMLENVAKESERMTPKPERQHALMSHPMVAPHPPSSVPPQLHPHASNRSDYPVIYSSGPGVSSYGPKPPSQQQYIPSNIVPSHDPFTVRPRTSNAFHPNHPLSHIPRASMNDEQLRFMMAGVSPRVSGAATGAYQRPFVPPLPPSATPYFQSQPPPSRMLGNPSLQVVTGTLHPASYNQQPGPLSAPPVSPTTNTFLRTSNPPNNAHLLSILNTPGMVPSAPIMPASFADTLGPR
ncbi:Dcp2, box A domain-containing protein [Abortiporus biennis]|nr:Dcp2, box A domain-containing protein [Abortiporus biennis]